MTFSIASGRRACSSSRGVIARTERRASARLSRASWVAACRWPSSSLPCARACAAASSWATIPARPCASVSWISRAARWRSCIAPVSRSRSSVLQRDDEHQARDQDVDDGEGGEERGERVVLQRPAAGLAERAEQRRDDHRRRLPPAGQVVDGQVADEHEEPVERAARDERGGEHEQAGDVQTGARRVRSSCADASIHASVAGGEGERRAGRRAIVDQRGGDRREPEQHVRQRRERALDAALPVVGGRAHSQRKTLAAIVPAATAVTASVSSISGSCAVPVNAFSSDSRNAPSGVKSPIAAQPVRHLLLRQPDAGEEQAGEEERARCRRSRSSGRARRRRRACRRRTARCRRAAGRRAPRAAARAGSCRARRARPSTSGTEISAIANWTAICAASSFAGWTGVVESRRRMPRAR